MSRITRKKRKDNFTIVNNDIPNNSNLSWKAKGLLLYLISRPDDWVTYISQLTKASKDGKESTSSGINELIKAGYIKRTAERDKKGKFKGYEYLVSDEPEYLTEQAKPENGKAVYGKPENGKASTTKKGNNKELKEQRTDNTYSEDFLYFWNQYHTITQSKKGPKEATFKHWNKLTKTQQQKALDKIQQYSDSVNDSKYVVYARTYLSDKRFNDEFESKPKGHILPSVTKGRKVLPKAS